MNTESNEKKLNYIEVESLVEVLCMVADEDYTKIYKEFFTLI